MRQRHAFIVILILPALVFRGLEVGGQEWFPKEGEKVKYLTEEEVRKEGRSLGAFQVCSGCTCCTGGRGQGQGQVCSKWSCCYSITCGLPDKPYGVCAFTPNSCNCTSCGSGSRSGSGSGSGSGSRTMAYPVTTTTTAKPLGTPSPSQSQSTRNSSSSSSSSPSP